MSKFFVIDPTWSALLESVGLCPQAVLAEAGLPSTILVTAEARLAPAQYYAFWQAISSLAGSPYIGLKMVDQMSAEFFDPVVFAALCSVDLNAALARIAQFKPLICPIRLSLEVGAEVSRLTWDFGECGQPAPEPLLIAELAFAIHFARLATKTRMVATKATLPIKYESSSPLSHYLGIMPSYSEDLSLEIASEDASISFVSMNPRMMQFFEPRLSEQLMAMGGKQPTAARVMKVLTEILPRGKPSLQETARRLAVSPRTLQRKLSEEGVGYQELLSGQRKSLAVHYLESTLLPSSQIAFLLGFSDSGSFSRAFQGWLGMTPEVYRKTANKHHGTGS